MPGQGRLGDKANISADAHGCPGCPHPGVGPAIQGSPDVLVNGRPALRVDDVGIHAACCGPNMWKAHAGSATVFINGKAAFRMNDPAQHCGGQGKLIEGSADVVVGDSGGGGGGGGGGAGDAARSGGASGGSSASSGGGASSPTAGGSSSAAPAEASPPAASAPASGDPAHVADSAAPATSALDELDWIEVALVGEDGRGVAGERYRVTPPSGPVREGFLDGDGRARVFGLARGSCIITFPELDQDAWEPLE